jgi:hypothetical protein
MSDRISTDLLKQRIHARIKELGKSKIFISGSFISTGRKCGNPACHCATDNKKHPCCLITSKVKGKTKNIYIPVDMQDEVEKWVREYKKVKTLIKEIDVMSEQIIKQHVSTKQAVNKNLKRLNQSRQT